MASLRPLLFVRIARTAILRSATWMLLRGSLRNVRYQPFGFTLHDLTKTRSLTTTTQMPMKRCGPVPARMRRPLFSRRAAKVSSENCCFPAMRSSCSLVAPTATMPLFVLLHQHHHYAAHDSIRKPPSYRRVV